MIYLIYGRDVTKVNFYLDKIRLENPNFEELIFDNPSQNQNFLMSNLYTPPLLANHRILILENFTNFAKVDFEKIDPKVDVVIIARQDFRPKFSSFENFAIIDARKNPQIFKFLDELTQVPVRANLAKLLRILQDEDPFFVFHQLITHFRRLILTKSGSLIDNLADWQIAKYQKICQETSFEKLKTAYKLILATEISLKTQGKDLMSSLPVLIVRLTQIFQNP